VIGLGHQVACCLGNAVGTAGFDWRAFGELLGTCQGEVTVDFIGADVEEASSVHAGVLLPLPAGHVQQDLGTQDVGAHEDVGAVNAAVHVGLGGKVDDLRGMVLGEDGLHGRTVSNVGLHEGVARVIRNLFDIVGVTGIRQRVEVDETDIGVLLHLLEDEARADEATAPGDKNCIKHEDHLQHSHVLLRPYP